VSLENAAAHVHAEVIRGDEALRAARELLRMGLLNDAVSRAYYSALHVARALLLTEGLDPKTHAGVSSMLSLHFIVPGRMAAAHGKELARLEQFRAEADYNRFFVFTPEGAAEEIAVAESFCAAGRSPSPHDPTALTPRTKCICPTGRCAYPRRVGAFDPWGDRLCERCHRPFPTG
jgi:uncharacterized protein (UPF0332 family)